MTAIKPYVIYDFAPGYMHKRLVDQAVRALQAQGLTQPAATLFDEMSRYRRNAPRDPQPRHMLPLITRFVTVIPENFITMESTLGKDLARQFAPRAEEIPPLVWYAQDWLDVLDPEEARAFRQKVSVHIECGDWTAPMLLNIVSVHLRRAGTNAYEARAYAAPMPESTDTRKTA